VALVASLLRSVSEAGAGLFNARAGKSTPASIVVTPAEVVLPVGQALQFTAAVKDAYGNPITGLAVQWRISDGTVASVTNCRDARCATNVKCDRVGGDQVGAGDSLGPSRFGRVREHCAGRGIPETIVFGALGETTVVSAVAENSVGAPISGITFELSSSDSSVAEVDSMGRLTANAIGATVISVSALCCGGTDAIVVQIGGAADTLTITVVNQNSVVVSNLSLVVGDSAYLDATAANVLGMSLGNVDPTWSSSNSAAASVTTAGVVYALTPGSTNIVASYGGVTATVPTTVTASTLPPPPPPSTGFTPNEPAGMSRLREIAFSSASDLTFPGQPGSQAGFVDSSAPFSPDRVARFKYPAGDGTEFFTGDVEMQLPLGTVRAYISYNWRLSTGFTLHPDNLKMWYFYRDVNQSQGSLVTGIQPTGGSLSSGSFRLNGVPQTAGGPGVMGPNQAGAPTLVRDRWYHTEVLVVMNTANGVANGTLKQWIDGTLYMNHTNVVYSEGSGSLQWGRLHLVPYYGGNAPGHMIPQDQYLYIDHAIISTSTTR
jgi:hypothetical protein